MAEKSSLFRNPQFSWDGPEFTTDELVTCTRGKDGGPGGKETFMVHKGHACAYSSVLKTALTSQNYVEGQMNKYEKDDASPSIWRLLVQCIYTQKFDIRPKEIPGTEVFLELKIVEVSESTAAEYKARDIKTGEKELTLLDCLCLDLAQLYCLAHYLQMFRLQNYVMKSLVEIFKMKDVCSSPGLDLLTKARRIPVPSENLHRKLHST